MKTFQKSVKPFDSVSSKCFQNYGGHLASNLGSVEIITGLHRIFNSPIDKFVYDVSHQTYPHKLLTGRNARFEEIRQHKGLCGFTHPMESSHDHFHAGHAGTALSLCLGLAKTRDLCGSDEWIVPVIGDATLTCGLSLEALNNIPSDLKRFVVILNDNAMSISKNVGNIKGILSRILSNPLSNKLYTDVNNLIARFPVWGEQLAKQSKLITSSIKNLVSPALFFEQYGLNYVGPIDGHDIQKVVDTLSRVKESEEPCIIHCLTNKGEGIPYAVKDPITYHGVKKFSIKTGQMGSSKGVKKSTFPQVFGEQAVDMAEKDDSIVVVSPAMLKGSCLDKFNQKFPERCFDVGIAEGHAVTFAGGLAYQERKKVFMSIYATFLQRALDNLFHDICLQRLPVVFGIDRAFISGPDGSTHHGIFDISFLNAMPNMVITQPRNGNVLKGLMKAAFDWNQPTAIRYPNLATINDDEDPKPRELGKGEVLIQGQEVLIIALGHMCYTAIEAREQLAKEGIYATVMDPIFVKPLDGELLSKLLLTHNTVITLEEHSVAGGLGSVVNDFIVSHGYHNTRVLNIGIPDRFIEFGAHGDILDEIGLTPEKVSKKILEEVTLSSFKTKHTTAS